MRRFWDISLKPISLACANLCILIGITSRRSKKKLWTFSSICGNILKKLLLIFLSKHTFSNLPVTNALILYVTNIKTLPLEEVKDSISLDESTFLEAQELHDLIQRAIMAIPENSREIFLKSRDENLTNQEIADKMNISIKTVEKHITRSLKIVKSIIGDSYIYLIFL